MVRSTMKLSIAAVCAYRSSDEKSAQLLRLPSFLCCGVFFFLHHLKTSTTRAADTADTLTRVDMVATLCVARGLQRSRLIIEHFSSLFRVLAIHHQKRMLFFSLPPTSPPKNKHKSLEKC